MTPALFRQLYSAFSDPGVYSDLILNYQISIATTRLDPNIWGPLLDHGIGLLVAHRMVLKSREDRTALTGGVPGEVKGPLTSRTVENVTNSYDTKASTYEDAGYWNLTTYGIEFFQLARDLGAGGVQL
jgi:hypothetical protein